MDSSADLSTQILNNPDIFQKLLAELIPIVYKGPGNHGLVKEHGWSPQSSVEGIGHRLYIHGPVWEALARRRSR